MGIVLFAGRLLLLIGLYGLAFLTVRNIWRGLPGVSGEPVGPRTVLLRLHKAMGAVLANEASWVEDSDLALTLPVTFGRRTGNTIRIEDPFVSSCHAELITDGSAVWLIDRGSKNGTWVGQQRLERPFRVESGGEFRFGGTVISLEE